jgi:dUTPase
MNDKLGNLDMGELFDDEMKSELDSILKQTQNMMGDWDYDPASMSIKLKVSFINKSNNPDPTYEKEGDSGFDIRAFIDEPIEIEPGCRTLEGVIAAVQTMGKTKFIKTDTLSSSDRGSGGFGSTGVS